MNIRNILWVLLGLALAGCTTSHVAEGTYASFRLAAAANIVEAVNRKDVGIYVRDLHPDVVVKMHDGEIRLRGREAVAANRQRHFLAHPDARNELVHLVEIDDRVIMHDRVWLHGGTDINPADIVEIFTFRGNQIITTDVLQPADLFNRRGRGQKNMPSK